MGTIPRLKRSASMTRRTMRAQATLPRAWARQLWPQPRPCLRGSRAPEPGGRCTRPPAATPFKKLGQGDDNGGAGIVEVLWVTPSPPTHPPALRYKPSGARSKALRYKMSPQVALWYVERGDSLTWMQPPSVTRRGTRPGSPPASPAVCGRGCNLCHM